MIAPLAIAFVGWTAPIAPSGPTVEVDRDEAPTGVADGRAALERAYSWLLENQRDSGAWSTSALDMLYDSGFATETYYAWQVASSALACLALLEAEETPERRVALERGLRWLCETRAPKRGTDWDIDYVWSGLYGTVTCTRAALDPRFADDPDWSARLAAAGAVYLDILERNQAPTGGWGYYDDPIYSQRPKWATSFSTALVLPALQDAARLGWLDDPAILARATHYVERCALPNGAYAYDLRLFGIRGIDRINAVKGSLGRIQVCNWALAEVGVKKITHERVRDGLAELVRHHKFLFVARGRPIPHEAYYQNAGYFYNFAHYYAALAIDLLPVDEREGWHAQLRPHVLATQARDGSFNDFLPTGDNLTAGTAYMAMALAKGLPPVGE